MSAWFALIAPVATIIALRVWWRRSMVWWEYLLPVGAAVVTIAIGKACADSIAVYDVEYWGGWVTRATYYEPWDEEVPCRHPIYRTESYPCGTTKSPQTCTRQVLVGYMHSYDVDYHPAHWEMRDSNKEWFNISQETYLRLSQKWGGGKFRELNRDYHSIDGNAYDAAYTGDWNAMEPTTVRHTYENRVAVSKSIYSYPEVNPKKSPVFEYPDPEDWRCDSVLSKRAWPYEGEIERLNAALGAKKQVRVWVLIWGDVPRQVGFDQEAYWKGSNKNELVICISQKGGEVQWAHVFSWSKSEGLKTAIESYLAVDHRMLDFGKFAPWLKSEIESKWVRRNWKDFDYLSVEPPTWALILIWIVTIGACIGTAAWCVTNSEIAPEQ